MAILLSFTDTDGTKRICDAKCYNATTKKCTCICGGRNHGVGKEQAIINTHKPRPVIANEHLDKPLPSDRGPFTITVKGCWATREVWIDNEPLDPAYSQSVRNHSPDGFCWGYGGSGPAQLALAILLKYHSKEVALDRYQHFKWNIIASLPKKDFRLVLIV